MTYNRQRRYIVECVNYDTNEQGLRTPNRQMIGPFFNFGDALEWLNTHTSKYEDLVMHALHRPNKITASS